MTLDDDDVVRLADAIAQRTGSPYYTQDTSPLGKRRHMALCRAKQVPCWKHGRFWFARKDAVHSWIERSVPDDDALPGELNQLLDEAGVRDAS